MTLSDLIIKHFPHPAFNPGQKEAIEFCVHAVLNQNKKHILLELPTGIGKSAVATTLHRVLHHLRNGDHTTTIVTATKGLQEQYLKDDSAIINLYGKKNYGCPKGAGHYTSEKCMVHVHAKTCNPHASCPYVKTRKEWKESSFRMTNHSFEVKAPPIALSTNNTQLLIIDECHVIDDQLIDNAKIVISAEYLKRFEKTCGLPFTGKFIALINEMVDYKVGTVFVPDKSLREEVNTLLSVISHKITELDVDPGPAALLVIAELRMYAYTLGGLLSVDGEWLVDEYAFSSKISLTPVYAHQVSQHALFSKADQFIHMSATICGFDEYKKTLGILDSESAVFEVPNPIPLDHRPIVPIEAVKVSGSYSRADLINAVDMIIARHGEESGVIHTVSFQLAKEILERSKHANRMLISNDRKEILHFLKKNGSILLSPSVETGYDFKGDLARWQIIAKVPYGFLGDPYIKLNMARSSKWYARKAIVRLVQAAGRAVRGVDDYADTYIIDSNFARLYSQNKELFPTWFRDAVIKT